jgi:hypothetical protein
MNTAQISHLLRADPYARDVLVSVSPRDRLPLVIKSYPSAFVCNTDPHREAGEHWVALYVTKDGCGEYFDSYGLPPLHTTFVNFLNTHYTSWTSNDMQLQGLISDVCGQYCVFYLLHRCRGLPMNTIVHMFGQNLQDNDVLVHDFVVVKIQ